MDTNGEPRDVRVVEATPPGVFDRAAIAAVKRWHYEPVIANGAPVEVPVRTTIRFELPRIRRCSRRRRCDESFQAQIATRQLVTVGVGTLLTLVMGGVLIAGFRLATQMNANVTALQTASMLQTYPDTIAAAAQLAARPPRGACVCRPGAGRPEARPSSASTGAEAARRAGGDSSRSSSRRCCCGTSTARWSIRSSTSTASRTSTPTRPAAPSRTKAARTTPT